MTTASALRGAIALLFTSLLVSGATFPLPIPKRPTSFPLSIPSPAGEVVGWGANDAGQASPPANATNFVAVAAGYKFSLGLRNDGKVVAWGAPDSMPPPPSSLANVVAISVGQAALALRNDGTVFAWGPVGLAYGQTNLPPNLRNVVAIAAGAQHGLALRVDGTVAAWGASDATNVPPSVTNIVAIAAGNNNSCALRADGSFISWGETRYFGPLVLTDVAGIAGGPTMPFIVVRRDGSLIEWPSPYFTPTHLRAVNAALSDSRRIAINSDRTVMVWNANGNTRDFADLSLTIPPRLRNVIAVAAGWDHLLALRLPSPPIPSTATAKARIINGFIVALDVIDGGEGYSQPPIVTITEGGGSGASAVAQVTKGVITGFTVTDAGSGYSGDPKITIEPPPDLPRLYVAPSRVNVVLSLTPGHSYQLEAASDVAQFTAIGSPFVAQTSTVTNEVPLTATVQFFRFKEAQ